MSAAHPIFDRRAQMIAELQRNVPHELRELSAWLLWRAEPKAGRPGQWDKIPHYASGRLRRGHQGSTEDSEQLSDFAGVMSVLMADTRERFAGVGFAILPWHPVTAVDLDNLDSDPGRQALADEILRSGAYCETSPSGNGRRAFFKGKAGLGNVKNHAAGVEIFESAGFVTLTGAELSDGADLMPMPDELRAQLAAILGKAKDRSAPKARPTAERFDLNRLPLDLAPRIVAGFPSGAKDRSAYLYWRCLDLRRAGLSDAQALAILGDPDLPWIVPALERRGGDIEGARDWLWKYAVRPSYDADIGTEAGATAQPWPDPQPLPPELHPVQPFDLDLLPDSLRPWIADVCERVQCPPDFVAVPVMVALGSLIGRKVRIRPKALDSWTVVPNVWGCIIGRPGTMKSPAVSEALQPLRRLEAQAREEYEALHTDFESQCELSKLLKEAAKDKVRAALKSGKGEASIEALRVDVPDEPVLRRYAAHQSSVQALGELLRQNPNGLLVERDELASLLSTLAQEEQAEARGFYLTGADGVSGFTFDTIGRGLNLRVPAVCLSIIGTTQPGKVGRYLRQAQAGGEGDDGMMQRFGLMVWPDGSPEWRNVDRWPDTEARRQAAEVFDRLDRITAETAGAEQDEDCAFLRFAPDALEAFTEWRTGWEQRLRSGEWHPALESHFAKYRKTIPALALILHLAEGASGPVTIRATVRALAWSEYLEAHALRCYGATVAGEIAAARRILSRIRKGELLDGFKAREVERKNWSELTDRDTLRAALGLLVAHGYLREIEVPSTAAGGRPTLAYLTHPGLRDELA